MSSLRTVPPLSPGELARMQTRALLARLNALRQLHETAEATDWSPAELRAAAGLIAFKDSPGWAQAMKELKAELATREHVARGKAARQAAQKAKQTR